MDNKLFDHIEEQMRTAANSWEPAFDEKAWEDMERKLEGENDNKRPVAWWSWLLPLLFLLITGGYFLLEKTTTSNQGDSPEDSIVSESSTTASKEIASGNGKDNSNNTADSLPVQKISYPVSYLPYETPVQTKGRIAGASTDEGEAIFEKNNFTIHEKGKMMMKVSAGRAGEEDKNEITTEEEPNMDGQQKEAIQVSGPDTSLLKKEEKRSPVSREKKADTTARKNTKAKNKKDRPSSKFYFSVAAGMEGNGVDFPGINKFGARAGFITGYQLTKKLSVQTGFFAGNKKYVAGKGDYKAKGGYWAMVDITKVAADCRVYEIPLALRYDFTPSAKWNSFAIAGLSSYIMDKEDYAYDYIRFGTPYYGEATYKGNQHFLSVIRLSGGIERKVTSQFSLGINPGIAIPLAGVGEGQIKLFSTELLVSLKYRPFKRSL